MSTNQHPVLYSFRRCPYAMRARLAIASSGIVVELREVVLKDKPAELIALSPKATVPVLHTVGGVVIDESLDIMYWALKQHDPQQWLQLDNEAQTDLAQDLLTNNDGEFKYYLDRYKYADRYPQQSERYYRQQGEKTLQRLDTLLQQHRCLLGDNWRLVDIALLPFIRHFAAVDPDWFNHSPYRHVNTWLNNFTHSELFQRVMLKYDQWQTGQAAMMFP